MWLKTVYFGALIFSLRWCFGNAVIRHVVLSLIFWIYKKELTPICDNVWTTVPVCTQAEDSDLSESSGSVEEVVIKIIRVFVDALPHVPEHRRLPILAQLITTVGGDKFLWVLLVLLFEQYVTKTVTATSSTDKVRRLVGSTSWSCL